MDRQPIKEHQLHVNRHVETTQRWPRTARKVAESMVETYGLPHEVTETMLIWHYNGPWKRTIVHRDGAQHNFPRPHVDILEQTVNLRIPQERRREIEEFDGSVLIDKTRGEVTVHCDCEETNTLILNLVYDIAISKTDATNARDHCKKATAVLRIGWPDPYMQKLRFTTPPSSEQETPTQDPDRSI